VASTDWSSTASSAARSARLLSGGRVGGGADRAAGLTGGRGGREHTALDGREAGDDVDQRHEHDQRDEVDDGAAPLAAVDRSEGPVSHRS
jgi:hypothetical protein